MLLWLHVNVEAVSIMLPTFVHYSLLHLYITVCCICTLQSVVFVHYSLLYLYITVCCICTLQSVAFVHYSLLHLYITVCCICTLQPVTFAHYSLLHLYITVCYICTLQSVAFVHYSLLHLYIAFSFIKVFYCLFLLWSLFVCCQPAPQDHRRLCSAHLSGDLDGSQHCCQSEHQDTHHPKRHSGWLDTHCMFQPWQ